MQKNRLSNIIFAAMLVGAFTITAFGQSGPTDDDVERSIALAEANTQEAAPGSFVYRDPEGNERVLTNVVRSTQYQAMIEEQKRMNDLLVEIRGLITTGSVAVPDVEQVQVYINTATYEELQAIPGIGAVKAGAIIASRGQVGVVGYNPFSSWSDLAVRVNGIGQGTIGDIQAAGVVLDEPDPAP